MELMEIFLIIAGLMLGLKAYGELSVICAIMSTGCFVAAGLYSVSSSIWRRK